MLPKDDDDIETAILVRITSEARPVDTSPARADTEPDIITSNLISASALADETHGSAIDNCPAACSKTSSSGPFDCEACLQASFEAIGAELSTDEFGVLSLLKSYLATVGAKGVTKAQLQVSRGRMGAKVYGSSFCRQISAQVISHCFPQYLHVLPRVLFLLRSGLVTRKSSWCPLHTYEHGR